MLNPSFYLQWDVQEVSIGQVLDVQPVPKGHIMNLVVVLQLTLQYIANPA